MFSSMANVTVGHTHFLSIQLPTECVQTGEHIVEPCTVITACDTALDPSLYVCVCVIRENISVYMCEWGGAYYTECTVKYKLI